MMNKPKAPCKDCKERRLGCHSECEKYDHFLAENEEYKKQKAENSKWIYMK